MRTKTLLLTAALSAVSMVAAVAQTVYSVNAVGYVKVGPIAPGAYFLAANPLNLPTNSIPAVLPDVPNNTVVYVLSATGSFQKFTKRATGWSPDPGTTTINPGTGFFIQNATTATSDLTVTFVGEVLTGTQTITYPAGFSLLGSKIPQEGKLQTDLGLTPANNDVVYLLVGSSYVKSTKRSTGWSPSEPIIPVGNGFFYQATAAGTWTRTFNVNQ